MPSRRRCIRPPERHGRVFRLAFVSSDGGCWLSRLGILASEGNDDAVAELARAIGDAVFSATDAKHLVLRCRRLRPSELDSGVDYSLDDDATYETLYSADILRRQPRCRADPQADSSGRGGTGARCLV